MDDTVCKLVVGPGVELIPYIGPDDEKEDSGLLAKLEPWSLLVATRRIRWCVAKRDLGSSKRMGFDQSRINQSAVAILFGRPSVRPRAQGYLSPEPLVY